MQTELAIPGGNGHAAGGLMLAPTSRFSVEQIWEMSVAVHASGLFPGIKSPQAAYTLMLLCDSEGLHPIQAVKRYHIIEGRPAMRADAMLADFQKGGGWVRWEVMTALECSGIFGHRIHMPDGIRIAVRFSDFPHLNHKANWKNHGDDMLVARAISKGVRRVDPGVIVGVYTPDELEEAEGPSGLTNLPMPKPIDVTPKPPAAPEAADVPVIGWRGSGYDSRSYLQVVKDAVSEVNSEFAGKCRAAGHGDAKAPATANAVHADVLRHAAAEEIIARPEGPLKASEVLTLIAEKLYPAHRGPVRAAVDAACRNILDGAMGVLETAPADPEPAEAEAPFEPNRQGDAWEGEK